MGLESEINRITKKIEQSSMPKKYMFSAVQWIYVQEKLRRGVGIIEEMYQASSQQQMSQFTHGCRQEEDGVRQALD